MASNENGRLGIIFVPVLLIDGLVQINLILCVCVCTSFWKAYYKQCYLEFNEYVNVLLLQFLSLNVSVHIWN